MVVLVLSFPLMMPMPKQKPLTLSWQTAEHDFLNGPTESMWRSEEYGWYVFA